MHNAVGNTVAVVLPTTQLTQHSLTTFVLTLKFMSGQIFFMATADLIWTKNNCVESTNRSSRTYCHTTAKRKFRLHAMSNMIGTQVMV